MKIFLHLKHWQLFLLLVGLPLALELISIPVTILTKNPFMMLPIGVLVMVVSFATLFGWLWALGVNLHAKLPPGVQMNLGRFRIFLLVPIFFCCVCSIPVLWIGEMDAETGVSDPMVVLIFVLLILFSMFCILYCFYFVAKALRAVELQRPVIFGDYGAEWLLMWFYYIGVWVIQPRINKLFSKAEESAYL